MKLAAIFTGEHQYLSDISDYVNPGGNRETVSLEVTVTRPRWGSPSVEVTECRFLLKPIDHD